MIKIKRRILKKTLSKELRRKLSLSHGGKGILKEDKPIQLCECGCGEYANYGKKYIHGHNGILNAGENNPAKRPEVREKNRQWHLGKEPWNKGLTKETDERVMQASNSINNYWKIEENRKKKSEETQKLWANNKYRNNHLKGLEGIGKKLWENPLYREKIMKVKEENKTSEKISKTIKNLWQDEEHRNKHLETLNSPEWHEAHSGENNHFWQGGKSFEIYPQEWNNKLKESIRKRDNYECQVCNLPQNLLDRKLHIHHIDYNKENCNKNNLISLCNSCHMKTNLNRDKWTEFFKLKIINKISEILISYLPVHQIIKGNENYRTGV